MPSFDEWLNEIGPLEYEGYLDPDWYDKMVGPEKLADYQKEIMSSFNPSAMFECYDKMPWPFVFGYKTFNEVTGGGYAPNACSEFAPSDDDNANGMKWVQCSLPEGHREITGQVHIALKDHRTDVLCGWFHGGKQVLKVSDGPVDSLINPLIVQAYSKQTLLDWKAFGVPVKYDMGYKEKCQSKNPAHPYVSCSRSEGHPGNHVALWDHDVEWHSEWTKKNAVIPAKFSLWKWILPDHDGPKAKPLKEADPELEKLLAEEEAIEAQTHAKFVVNYAGEKINFDYPAPTWHHHDENAYRRRPRVTMREPERPTLDSLWTPIDLSIGTWVTWKGLNGHQAKLYDGQIGRVAAVVTHKSHHGSMISHRYRIEHVSAIDHYRDWSDWTIGNLKVLNRPPALSKIKLNLRTFAQRIRELPLDDSVRDNLADAMRHAFKTLDGFDEMQFMDTLTDEPVVEEI
jgi:hypothetical protein